MTTYCMDLLVRNRIGLGILTILIIISLFVFRDYGLSWDETAQRKLGEVTYNYIFNGNDDYKKYHDKDYGVAFELPLISLEKLLNLHDPRVFFLFRHLITHLFFLFAAFHLYLLLKLFFENEWIAVIGFLLLVLQPRIYGHSFFNTKDIPFLSMMIISLYHGALAFRNNNFKNTAMFGVATGLMINIRIMGTLLFVGSLFLYFIDMLLSKNDGRKRIIIQGSIFSLCTAMTLYITWPYLWKDPVNNFIQAFVNMSRFRWDGSVLYMGEMIKATELPWHYSIVWISITTPLVFLSIILIGIIVLLLDYLKNPLLFFFKNWHNKQLFLYLLCSFGSISAVIVLQSVLYDGWRQLFFVYPCLILIGMYGIHQLFTRYAKYKKHIASLLVLLVLLSTIPSMILIHPFQNVFFNSIVPKTDQYLRKNFEMDYWGTSYKATLEKILSDDARSIIHIGVANYPGVLNSLILPPNQRNKIKYVNNFEIMDYFITNYRNHPQDYEYRQISSHNEWHNMELYHSKISSIFKLKNSDRVGS